VSLYVDGYNLVTEEWTTVGSTPYLDVQDQPSNYGYTSTNLAEWSEFSFADLSGSPTVNSVSIYVYCEPNAEEIIVNVYDAGVPGYVAAGSFTDSGWGWRSIDISTTLTTDAEVDAAKVYFEAKKVGAKFDNPANVDCAYLYVDYSAGAQSYEFQLNQSYSLAESSSKALGMTKPLDQPYTLGSSITSTTVAGPSKSSSQTD